MAGFHPAEAFDAKAPITLLPLRFERGTSSVLVSNFVGDFVALAPDEFDPLIALDFKLGDSLYEKAYAAHLISRRGQQAQLQLLALRLRSRMAVLRYPTPCTSSS